jgi:DNA-binding LytR/AlgR family response regulator
MTKAVIIEDETLAANRLEAMVQKCDGTIDIIAKIPSVKAAVQWFQQNPPPDLVFMDIHLEDGSSFSIFDQTDVAAPVIFTTAFDEYAIKAFKVNSIDYLLKPINIEELIHALDQFRKLKLSGYHYSEKGEASIENLKKSTLKSRFLVTSGSKMLSIPIAEVAYFYSEDKITFLQTFKNNRYAIEYSLDKLIGMLQPDQYFKINRQLIINIKSIGNVHKVSVNRLKITLTPEYSKDIFVSVEKYSAFKDWLDA